jgi:hypothetical protein
VIIGPDFIWMHLPKAAGTETEAVLRAAFGAREDISFDPIVLDNVIWHHTIAQRAAYDPEFSVGERRVICNFRRLPSWLLSWTHFLHKLHPEHKATRAMLMDGRVWEWDGRISSADDYVRLYDAYPVDAWIRQEHLLDDIERVFQRWLPSGIDLGPLLTQRNALQTNGLGLQFYFTGTELECLYDRNPLWAALEKRVYGNLLTL